MKWSKYNSTIHTDDRKYILYNCVTNKILVFTEELKDLIYRNSLPALQTIHPDLYASLIHNHFIIDKEIDEVEIAIRKQEKELNTEDYFGIMINPTLDCNLRCWYCYETHQKGSRIHEMTMNSIKKLLKNKIENSQLTTLGISFFGGEPLMKFKQTVSPLLDFAHHLCSQYGIRLNIGFTTNAVLLTSEVTDCLSSLGRQVALQVPFDGNRELYNKVKATPDGKGVYDITLKNIQYAIVKRLYVNIRCNYHIDNLSSFKDLIDEFKDMDKICYESFHFSFQPVWQTHDKGEKTTPILKDIRTVLNAYGMRHDGIKGGGSLGTSCYADRPDNLVVNYNGDIYKCTSQDFLPESREGVLNPDGTITYNEKYEHRMKARFSHAACIDCSIMPVCYICSQKKLNEVSDTCPGNLDEYNKLDIIQNRIKELSNNKITFA